MNNQQIINNIINALIKYDSMQEFLQCENMDKLEFEELYDNGWYSEITCGTFNGASNTFTPYQLNEENVILTLSQMMNDFNFWEFINDLTEDEAINNNWHGLLYINQLVNFYDIIIIENERRLYIDRN